MDQTNYVVRKASQLGATDVCAKGESSKNEQLRFSNNEIDVAQTWYEDKITVLLAYNKKVVTSEIRDFKTIDESLNTLMKLAKVSQENPHYAGIAQGPFHYAKVRSDPQLVNLQNTSDYVTAAVNKALENAVETAGILQVTNRELFVSSSGGVEACDHDTNIELSVRAFSQKEASGHSVTCSPTLKGFEPEKAGEEAGELARLAKDPVQGGEGVVDVVFSPLFFGSLLSYSAEMTSAFNVFAGRSMYVGKIGKKVASECVNVVDSPSGFEQRIFDDEGVPTRDTTVVERGILKTYLHNTSTAAKLKAKTTASAGFVIPRPLNFHLKPGDLTREELFEAVDNGLYVTNTWYTRFQNMQTGDFSTIPRDAILKIEKGEITGSVKNVRVSDNLLKIYESIEGLSKEQKLIHWWIEVEFPCVVPHVLVRKVNITRSTQ